ncbi:MAG: 30S ribosomal protein S6e [Nanoarchaeota archaeon]|nr:30S ribosomal protein S6e [Nanoarchaeota archaeon]
MSEFKIVIADPKTGKCHQREIKDDETNVFLGLKIGATLKGDTFNLSGYEFKITGGSDKSGFPMRKDLDTTARKKILVVSGVGAKRKRKGQRQRKSVRGNTVSDQVSQINLKILKYGKEKLGVEAPAEENKEAAPAKEKKE